MTVAIEHPLLLMGAVPQTAHLNDAIATAVVRAPEWLRADLLSHDPSARLAAEETLAAMIRAALDDEKTTADKSVD